MNIPKTVLTTLVFVLAISFPVQCQWQPFVDQMGTQVPFDPVNPLNDLQLKIQWFTKAKPILEKYSLMVAQELNCNGFSVVKIENNSEQTNLNWSSSGVVLKAGMKIKFSINFLTPIKYSPKQFVDELQKNWERYRDMVVREPWAVLDHRDTIEITNWKELFFWEPTQPTCTVMLIPGSVCYTDINTSQIKIVNP